MIPLTLGCLSIPDTTRSEAIEIAAAVGFSGVTFKLASLRAGEGPPLPFSKREVLGLRRLLVDNGLQVLDVETITLRPDTAAADFVPFLETAAAIGARHVIAVGLDPVLTRCADNFAALCKLAGSYPLRAMLEFLPIAQVRSFAQALEIVRYADSPAAGLLFDCLHAARTGTRVEELAAVDKALVPYFQLCDAPAESPPDSELGIEARYRRLPPGEGGLPLRSFMAALPAGIEVSVEAPVGGPDWPDPPSVRAGRLYDATRHFLDAG